MTILDCAVTPGGCRWDVESVQLPGEVTVPFGALLGGVDLFDASAFGISVPEAVLMDPQQRLLMEAAAEALTAGLRAATSKAARCASRAPSG